MPILVWLALIGGAGVVAIATKKKPPSPFAGWTRIPSANWGMAAKVLAATITTTGQNSLMSPDGTLMAVRNGETVEVYQRT